MEVKKMMLAFLEPVARFYPRQTDRREKYDRRTLDEMRYDDLMTLVDRPSAAKKAKEASRS